jgi:hypothetical protein
MQISYPQIQSHMVATCFGVIYAILKELVHIKRSLVGLMNEQLNSIHAHWISKLKAARRWARIAQSV